MAEVKQDIAPKQFVMATRLGILRGVLSELALESFLGSRRAHGPRLRFLAPSSNPMSLELTNLVALFRARQAVVVVFLRNVRPPGDTSGCGFHPTSCSCRDSAIADQSSEALFPSTLPTTTDVLDKGTTAPFPSTPLPLYPSPLSSLPPASSGRDSRGAQDDKARSRRWNLVETRARGTPQSCDSAFCYHSSLHSLADPRQKCS